LLTSDYFLTYFSKPASLSFYIGDFLTQFYYLIAGGAVTITISLFILWLVIGWLFKRILNNSFNKWWFILPLFPVAFEWILLCSLSYPLGHVVALILTIAFSLGYTCINKTWIRLFIGIAFISIIYIISGSYVFLFVFFMLSFEWMNDKKRLNIFYTIACALFAILIPWLLYHFYLLSIGQAVFYPVPFGKSGLILFFSPMLSVIFIFFVAKVSHRLSWLNKVPLSFMVQIVLLGVICYSGIKTTSNFRLEKILALDYQACLNNWEDVYLLSQSYHMRDPLATYYTNIALSKMNMLPDRLLENYQPASLGLFIPVDANENYVTISFSNEVYYHLGDVVTSQHYALSGMIFSPNGRSTRLMKRLAENNIINKDYAVAEKFLKILDKTLFYRRWAADRMRYLYNEKECARSNWIVEKRSQLPTFDIVKKSNDYETCLHLLLESNPANKPALDYLLCYYLLNKNIPLFAQCFDKYYKTINNSPSLYQEAMLIYLTSSKAPEAKWRSYNFSNSIVARFIAYTNLYESNNGNGVALQKEYDKTYWFYYHFAKLEQK
jgi:hypothetical protein